MKEMITMVEIRKVVKPSFAVIGKEGSTDDGEGFIQRLWADANAHYGEVQALAKVDENGQPAGFWGAMSDMGRTFAPWENFQRGLYLAGVEVRDDAQAPEGWVKWVVPGYEYLTAACDEPDAFGQVNAFMQEQGIPLAGAVHDFTDPADGKNYVYFPIRKL